MTEQEKKKERSKDQLMGMGTAKVFMG